MSNKQERLAAVGRGIERLDHRIGTLVEIGNRYSWARVLLFLGGFGSAVVLYFWLGTPAFVLAATLALLLFLIVVVRHRRIEHSRRRLEAAQAFYREQLARAAVDWEKLPPARVTAPAFDHPFEGDLDLVGPYGLHRLLDTAVSTGGSTRLHTWLTATAPDRAVILERQALLAELAPRTLFRLRLRADALAATGDQPARAARSPEELPAWLQQHQESTRLLPRLLLLGGLALLNLGAVAGAWLGLIGPLWQVTLPLYLAVYFALSRPARSVFLEASSLQAAIEQFTAVVRHVESFGYANAPRLRRLCAPLIEADERPSALLGRVKRVAAATGIQGNPIIWLALNVVVPWDYFFAYQLNQQKQTLAGVTPAWLTIWAELEALSALANLAWLNPHYALPTLHADPDGSTPVFAARQLGHPLLSDESKICNDFTFDALGDVVILTGSNMAGKSTFLRTLGVNLALAYAGGPVDAAALETRLFHLFTCIKVSDSVADGISYFYAEVRRLKALLNALDRASADRPLFFLIDEIFRGTNNRERLQGSQAYVNSLLAKNGVGLISTHDLDLVKLADSRPTIANYHFRDDIRADRMHFDYILRPGPCPTTNALKIMALEGLPTGEGKGED